MGGIKTFSCLTFLMLQQDLAWFQEFASQWNGVSMKVQQKPGDRVITVEALGSLIGGTDGCQAYGGQ